ncbi:MAG: hypothetical protein U0L42_03085 [Methanobrevibacter sp.]|uniref:hypothetical protein n=1 Tax=Methanobrevibacter sp. TaxID=66852 RepID=UPI002E786FCA|nr:hypothetical protein [Methanobrevibacter sp.]MEE0934635.1 hypothetical protein [Methanobrevibacter sp.]
MILRIIFLIIILSVINRTDNDLEKYLKLGITSSASIKKSDLPSEFSDNAFKVVNEFIQKTIDLNYEILIFFDYDSGEILQCKIGEINKVKIELKENEFNGHNVASIHNHHKSVYTPPSPQNFSIFQRNFEDYELIAGWNGLWILKGKVKDEKLYFELKIISKSLFNLAFNYSKTKSENIQEIEDICDEKYGYLLSTYINNKNINKIQLNKKEYKYD